MFILRSIYVYNLCSHAPRRPTRFSTTIISRHNIRTSASSFKYQKRKFATSSLSQARWISREARGDSPPLPRPSPPLWRPETPAAPANAAFSKRKGGEGGGGGAKKKVVETTEIVCLLLKYETTKTKLYSYISRSSTPFYCFFILIDSVVFDCAKNAKKIGHIAVIQHRLS